MPTATGIYTPEEAIVGHDFSYRLAQWIGQFFMKEELLFDIGCGPATYLRYLHDIGFQRLQGLEGTAQNFEFGEVLITDLTSQLPLQMSGNAICLEVGEHIPEELLPQFLDNVTKLVSRHHHLLVSWATPGQDGIGHVSCRHNIWVIHELQRRGFAFLPAPSLSARSVIEERVSYFRNTIMLFQKQ